MKPYVLLEALETYTNNGTKDVVAAREIMLDCDQKRTYNNITELKVMTTGGYTRWVPEPSWTKVARPAESALKHE